MVPRASVGVHPPTTGKSSGNAVHNKRPRSDAGKTADHKKKRGAKGIASYEPDEDPQKAYSNFMERQHGSRPNGIMSRASSTAVPSKSIQLAPSQLSSQRELVKERTKSTDAALLEALIQSIEDPSSEPRNASHQQHQSKPSHHGGAAPSNVFAVLGDSSTDEDSDQQQQRPRLIQLRPSGLPQAAVSARRALTPPYQLARGGAAAAAKGKEAFPAGITPSPSPPPPPGLRGGSLSPQLQAPPSLKEVPAVEGEEPYDELRGYGGGSAARGGGGGLRRAASWTQRASYGGPELPLDAAADWDDL
ncbi:unnamed protein product [Heterosigma akashiwo]